MKLTMLFALGVHHKFIFVGDKNKRVVKIINVVNGVGLLWAKGMPKKIYTLQLDDGRIIEYSKNKQVMKLEYGIDI